MGKQLDSHAVWELEEWAKIASVGVDMAGASGLVGFRQLAACFAEKQGASVKLAGMDAAYTGDRDLFVMHGSGKQ